MRDPATVFCNFSITYKYYFVYAFLILLFLFRLSFVFFSVLLTIVFLLDFIDNIQVIIEIMDEESVKPKPLYTSTPLNKMDMKKRQLDRSGTPQSSISLSSPLHKNMKASKKGKDSSDVDDIFALYSDNDDTNKTSNGDAEYNLSNSMPDVEESASSIIEKSTHSTDKDGNEINEEDIDEEIDDGVDIVQDSISEVITEEKNAMTNALNDSQEPAQINEAIQESQSESQIVADSFEPSPIQKSNSTSNVMDNNIAESGQSKDILSEEKINSISNDLEKNFDGIELSNNDKSMNKVENEDWQNEDPKLINSEKASEEINVEKDSTYELSSNSEAIEEDAEQDIISVPAVLKNNARGPPVITPPQLNPEKPFVAHLPMQPPVQHGRLFGGAMTDERMLKIQGISNDVVTAMHSGILADDMGLGKTLSLISLILHKKNARKTDPAVVERENHLRRNCVFERHLIPANSTLVIAPASLIYQWEKEIMDRVQEGLLRVFIFHGPKNKREISAHRLSKYDIVITTYELLVSELKSRTKLIGQSDDSDSDSDNPSRGRGGVRSKPKTKSLKPKASHDSVLMDIAWERIILDEAHEIRNKNAQKSRCCSRLEAVHRWCLTGTPIHNKLWDLYSLIRF
ncbi:unnamed protein product [Meloidogyne enterolobii]|uniref:Uncharacterized protein n=1 Tax=Meloidogyne enterolobii TaxID=390850 RepID=A0ACB0XVH8_MELEN